MEAEEWGWQQWRVERQLHVVAAAATLVLLVGVQEGRWRGRGWREGGGEGGKGGGGGLSD